MATTSRDQYLNIIEVKASHTNCRCRAVSREIHRIHVHMEARRKLILDVLLFLLALGIRAGLLFGPSQTTSLRNQVQD
jgi:hypothetical protein